jgi:hypothetical protein
MEGTLLGAVLHSVRRGQALLRWSLWPSRRSLAFLGCPRIASCWGTWHPSWGQGQKIHRAAADAGILRRSRTSLARTQYGIASVATLRGLGAALVSTREVWATRAAGPALVQAAINDFIHNSQQRLEKAHSAPGAARCATLRLIGGHRPCWSWWQVRGRSQCWTVPCSPSGLPVGEEVNLVVMVMVGATLYDDVAWLLQGGPRAQAGVWCIDDGRVRRTNASAAGVGGWTVCGVRGRRVACLGSEADDQARRAFPLAILLFEAALRSGRPWGLAQVVQRGTKICLCFSSESICAVNLYLESHFISSLNDNCKRKKTPENGYLDSSRLVKYHFRPNRGTGLRCYRNS